MRHIGVVLMLLVCGAFASAAFAVVPGKDGRIFYDSVGDDSTDIWTIEPDGSGARDLTPADASEDTDPAVSPNGRQVAFVSDRDNEDANTFVWTMKADGSSEHKLGGGGVYQAAPAWSPDGKRIAFMRCAREVEGGGDCSTGQIAVIGVDGKGLELLTKPLRTVAVDSHPSWSPGGKTIVFERRVNFGNVTIWCRRPGRTGRRCRESRVRAFGQEDRLHVDRRPVGRGARRQEPGADHRGRG